MKPYLPILGLILLATGPLSGQQVDRSLGSKDEKSDLLWFDVSQIGIEGKAWDDTKAYYDRLPASAEGVVRPPVWSLSRHSAGMCFRFATDASSIHAEWELTSDRLAMNHMPATGVSGLDLYVRTDDGWRWLATGRPSAQKNTARLVNALEQQRRDYLLYLPLYNGTQSLKLGVPEDAGLWKRQVPSERVRPLVFWGTSITQGGCASRPGMVHTAILGRRFDRPVVNLGFSGNGRMEPEVAKLLAQIDAEVFIIDCLPNLDAEAVTARVERVVEIIRKVRPETPILLVEDRTYTDAFLVKARQRRNATNRVALAAAYQRMQEAGIKHLHYLRGDGLLGLDGEDTVDGSHPTDLGFWRQANAFEAALKPLLK